MLRTLSQRYPDRALYVLRDAGDEWIMPRAPAAAQEKYSASLNNLADIYLELEACYDTDTGMCHLVAGMLIPCVELFGPAVTRQNIESEEDNAECGWRIGAQQLRREGLCDGRLSQSVKAKLLQRTSRRPACIAGGMPVASILNWPTRQELNE